MSSCRCLLLVLSLFAATSLAASRADAVASWTLDEATTRKPVHGTVEAQGADGTWSAVDSGRQLPVAPDGRIHARLTLVSTLARPDGWVIYDDMLPDHEAIVFRVVHADGREEATTADANTPVARRTFSSRYLAARFHLEPGETAQLAVDIDTRGFDVENDFAVVGVDSFDRVDLHAAGPALIYLGIALFGALFGFVYGLALSERGLFAFGAYCLSWFIFIFVAEGFLALFFPVVEPFSPNRLSYLLAFSPSFWIAIIWREAPFASGMPRGARSGFLVLAVAIAALSLARFVTGTGLVPESFAGLLGLLVIFLTVVTSVHACLRRAPLAGYFLAVSLAMVGDIIFLFAWILGSPPEPLSFTLAIYALQSLIVAVLTVAMARRVRNLQAERVRGEVLRSENDTLRHMIQVVSHDLANQIMAIAGIAGLLRRHAASPDLELQAQRLERLALMQRDLVQQVRGLRALKEGKFRLKIVRAPVSEVLQALRDVFNDRFEVKRVTLELEAPAGEPPLQVLADPTSLEHTVLGNVLSNALKFSRPGDTVRLAVEADAGRVRFVVTDHGIGIPPELRGKLFDRQASTTRVGTSGETGTGFGLPLAKAFVEEMQGRITVESPVAGTSSGTRVTVEVPRG